MTVRSTQLGDGDSISEKIEPLNFSFNETQFADFDALSA
jgi:hypothetical protein